MDLNGFECIRLASSLFERRYDHYGKKYSSLSRFNVSEGNEKMKEGKFTDENWKEGIIWCGLMTITGIISSTSYYTKYYIISRFLHLKWLHTG